jgi:hypothetical protein
MSTVRLTDGSVGERVTEEITPARARRWLRTTRGAMNQTKAQAYSNLLASGRFRDGGQVTIKGGFVMSGRHLLAAVASTGIPLRVNVLRIHDPQSSHPELR